MATYSLHLPLLPPLSPLRTRSPNFKPLFNAPCLFNKHMLKFHSTSKPKCLPTEQLQISNMPNGVDEEFENQLQELFVQVKAMLTAGNKTDAIDLLRANYEAVKAEMKRGSRGIEQAALLDILALGYLAAGEFTFVSRLLKMLSEVMGGLDDGEPRMDSILAHMGSMYMHLSKFEEALCVYKRGLGILEREVGDYSPFLLTPLMGMAKVYGLNGKATEAIQIYRRAVCIVEKSRGTDSEELIAPLLALGNLFIKERKIEGAEVCFRRIVCIYVEAYGESDGRVGMAMCSLARVLRVKGDAEEAISVYKKGLQVVKDSGYVALDDDILQKMRTDLAELLHATGNEKEGRELLQECLIITEKYKGIEHPSSVAYLVNLANSYSRSKNFVEAERLLRTCLQIMSKTVGLKDQLITVPMLHLAVTLYNLKRDEEAERLALEVVQIRENLLGNESLPVSEALDCLVSIQIRLGKDDDYVLTTLKRILNIQERELGCESEETVLTLKKVVFYLDKMGKKDENLPLKRRLNLLRTRLNQKVSV